MSYSTVNIADSGNLKGTGRKGKAQAGAVKEVFWASEDFSFASKGAAVDIANWNTAVAAGDLYYLGVVEEFDANDTEPTFYESPNGDYRIKTADAKRIRQYRFIESSGTHASLTSFNGKNGRLFFLTSREYLQGRMSGTAVQGFKTSQFDVELLTAATSDAPAFTPVNVTFDDPIGDDQNVFEDKIDFSFADVDQIYSVELRASGVTSGASLDFTLDVLEEFSDVPISGVSTSNLVAKSLDGTTLTIASATASGDQYDVSVTTTDSAITLQLDGVQLIGGILYSSAVLNVSS